MFFYVVFLFLVWQIFVFHQRSDLGFGILLVFALEK